MQKLLRIGDIRPNPAQPRTYFDKAEMQELEDSVREQGVLQPIIVRPLDEGFQIVAGERRWRAAKAVFGEDGEIPVIVRACSDEEAEVIAIIENAHRTNPSPTDEARAAHELLMRLKNDKQEAAARLSWTVQKLERRLALMRLTPAVREAVSSRKIMLGHGELLAAVPQDKQDAALEKIIKHGLSVEKVRQQIASIAHELKVAVFDKVDCGDCAFNSDTQAALFGEAINTGYCSNPACWEAKERAHLDGMAAALREEVPRVEIVGAGDAIETIPLVVEGALGVGRQQAAACRGCADFGATVSALPGSVGEVERSICFNRECHTDKVAANAVASRKAAAGPQQQQKAANAQGGTCTEAARGAGSKADASRSDSGTQRVARKGAVNRRVVEYRVKVWRTAAAKAVNANKQASLNVLLVIAATGDGRCIEASKVREIATKLGACDMGDHDVAGALEATAALNDDAREKLLVALAATAMKHIDERRLKAVMTWLGVDLADYWSLNAEYLGLMTKAEVFAVCEEIGLRAAMGAKAFKKAADGNREDLIKAVLKVDGFNYHGAVPVDMRYDVEGQVKPWTGSAEAGSSEEGAGDGSNGDGSTNEDRATADSA